MSLDNLRIHAIIPDGKNPESTLIGPDGQHPSEVFDPTRHRTMENVVHSIGQALGARALSVAMREQNMGDGSIVYRTKPMPDGIALPDGYTWQRVLEGDA